MEETPVPSIAVVFHRQRPAALSIAKQVVEWCVEHGIVVKLFRDDARLFADMGAVLEIADSFVGASLVVAVGGDGTMLRAVHSVAGSSAPVVGVNVGYLGYLTQVEPDRTLAVLDAWRRDLGTGNIRFEDRMMIEARLHDKPPMYALNEVVLEKQESGHTVRLSLGIGGSEFTTYVADGVILATPTGSTAYAMSARGPILSPQLRAVLVTPVSPHMLFDRSLVLDPAEEVRITVEGLRGVNVVVDGVRVHEMKPGDHLTIAASGSTARLLKIEERPFHRILGHKFGLADR